MEEQGCGSPTGRPTSMELCGFVRQWKCSISVMLLYMFPLPLEPQGLKTPQVLYLANGRPNARRPHSRKECRYRTPQRQEFCTLGSGFHTNVNFVNTHLKQGVGVAALHCSQIVCRLNLSCRLNNGEFNLTQGRTTVVPAPHSQLYEQTNCSFWFGCSAKQFITKLRGQFVKRVHQISTCFILLSLSPSLLHVYTSKVDLSVLRVNDLETNSLLQLV